MESKAYQIDISALSQEQKREFREDLDGACFTVIEHYGQSGGVDTLLVIWNSPEDFNSLIRIPGECVAQDVTGRDLTKFPF